MADGSMAGGAFWWPFVAMIVGAAATYASRALGVALSGRIDPAGEAFEWIACVAYALLSALIARMILLPTGPLAQVPPIDRVGAAALAFAIFFVTRRNIPIGVGTGIGALMVLIWARAPGL